MTRLKYLTSVKLTLCYSSFSLMKGGKMNLSYSLMELITTGSSQNGNLEGVDLTASLYHAGALFANIDYQEYVLNTVFHQNYSFFGDDSFSRGSFLSRNGSGFRD